MVRAALVAGLVATLAIGCAPAAAWQRVELPSVRASSLAVVTDGVLVGGLATENPAPALVRVRGAQVSGAVELRPTEPYAEVADLISLTVAGDRLYAIGRAFGGAHSNPRLTVWDGSLTAGVLTSRPQEFFTFGGHDAGPLLGTVALAAGPVIVGSRTTTAGIEGVLWTLDGTVWVKHTGVDPALGSSPDREVGFAAVARLGDQIILAGDELGLAGGLRQQPTLWSGSPRGSWRQSLLPVPDVPPVSGQLSRATAVACPESGDTCWVAGWVRGRPVAWPVTITADAVTPGGATVLPGVAAPEADPAPQVALVADRPAVLTNAAEPTLQLGCPDGWRTLPAPPGSTSALVAVGGSLYALADSQLWRLDSPAC